MTMITKKELVKELVEILEAEKEMKMTQKDVLTVIETLTDAIGEHLAKGEGVKLPGFVTFETAEVEARTARNPQTGEAVEVPAHNRVKVKLSSALKDKVR